MLLIADRLGWDRFGIAGVSGGGPFALAVAALAPERVARCSAIVTQAPSDAIGLDFYADMDPGTVADIEAVAAGGAAVAVEQLADLRDWVGLLADGTETLEAVQGPVLAMLIRAFEEGSRSGAQGYVDDCMVDVNGWGFDVADVAAPTRVMLARDDQSVPAAHGEWLVERLPQGELTWVDGGHFGPRDEHEELLMAWTAGRET